MERGELRMGVECCEGNHDRVVVRASMEGSVLRGKP